MPLVPYVSMGAGGLGVSTGAAVEQNQISGQIQNLHRQTAQLANQKRQAEQSGNFGASQQIDQQINAITEQGAQLEIRMKDALVRAELGSAQEKAGYGKVAEQAKGLFSLQA